VWCCNVGDSKCIRLRNGRLEQLSVDHTDAEAMKLNGITGRKPYVTQYLGIDSSEMTISPAVFKDDLRDGDMYVICSDGLTDMVTPERITEILLDDEDEEEKTQTLLVDALKHGGRDNVTIILCRVTEK
jgi:protein phosphatase